MQEIIIEKKLGIKPDYQHKAIRSKNFLQANWHKNKLHAIKILCNLNKKSRVLDLGTGSGNFELEFADKVLEIHGVDYNDEAISFLDSKLKEYNIKNVKLTVKDLKKINELNDLGKFDLIIMIDVIEHLPINESEKLIKSFSKFLKPQGQVFIVTPNYHSLWIIIEKILDHISILPKFDGEQHLSKFYKENLNNYFEENGYTTECFTTINTFSYFSPTSWLRGKLLQLEINLESTYGNLACGLYKLKR